MNFNRICVLLLVMAIGVTVSTGAYAQAKPRWVKKGVKELNDKRYNDTYHLQIFHQENADESVLYLDRFAPLVSYIDSAYNVPDNAVMYLDSIPDPVNGHTTYTLTFDNGSHEETVYAQLIDQFTRLDDFVLNHFEYNHYQLFAISNPGVTRPEFDDFVVTRHYNAAQATAMSIIPGLGQIYKGQNVKGWIFMATDLALVGTLVASVDRYRHYKHLRDTTGKPTWHNEIQTWREFMVFSAIGAAGLYVYNLFDAALCPITRRVEIHRPNTYNADITFAPVIAPDFFGRGLNVGLGMNINF